MYSSIVMLYATYVIDGKWDINNIPQLFKPLVEELIADLTKKPSDNVVGE